MQVGSRAERLDPQRAVFWKEIEMRRYGLWIGLGTLLGLLLIGAYALTRPYTMRGSQIEPPIPAADFTLTGADGQPFRLSDQRGKITLLFFGYTTCPDVCPATLSEMKQIRQRLNPQQADQISVVFITVDPERDTPERLGQYVSNFDPTFAGLTGSEAELAEVWKSYGVYREIREEETAVGYLVDHTARVYVVDQSGSLVLTYPFGTPEDDILMDLRYLLKKG